MIISLGLFSKIVPILWQTTFASKLYYSTQTLNPFAALPTILLWSARFSRFWYNELFAEKNKLSLSMKRFFREYHNDSQGLTLWLEAENRNLALQGGIIFDTSLRVVQIFWNFQGIQISPWIRKYKNNHARGGISYLQIDFPEKIIKILNV